MKVRRHHRPDEEPDFDELDLDYSFAAGIPGCTRCGHDDHVAEKCPIVVPHLLRIDS